MIPKFFGKVDSGVLQLENRELFKKYLCSIKGDVQVVVGKKRRNRTLKENNFYWGVVVTMLADYIGEDYQNMHEILKTLFLREIRYKPIKGKMIRLERVRSTTELSTVEFEEYVERIRRWAAQYLEFTLPYPNEYEETL